MKLTKEQRVEFEKLVQPIMKFLDENFNPHTRVLIDSNYTDLLDGVEGVLAESNYL